MPEIGESWQLFQEGLANSPLRQSFNGLTNIRFGTCGCPTPSFTWDNQTYTMTTHCEIMNDVGGIIAAIMFFTWTALAVFLFLRA